MSGLVKHIAALFPAPASGARYLEKSGLDVIFPFYHAVSDQPLLHMKHLYAIRNIKQFEEDLDYLLRIFSPISMKAYHSNRSQQSDKPRMVLSFDDGLIQCYDEIMPILKRKGIPAVFFINNAFIDNRSMFFRFKVSLLIERMKEISEQQLSKTAQVLHCDAGEIKKRLLAVSYVEKEITDQVAEIMNFSFDEYLRQHPVYLSSMHIKKMMKEGFEFGSHGIDHPLFSLLKSRETLDHITESVTDLQARYGLNYKYFAFPFTDYGVQDETIDGLFNKQIIDAGFGTAGLKDDKWQHYHQRVPMELLGMDARKTLRGELNRRRLRKLMGRNLTDRGDTSNAPDYVD